MGFFDFLQKTKTSESKDLISQSFSNSVEKSILLMSSSEDFFDEDSLYEKICGICENVFEAQEIYIFLPIAFVRLFLPKINWSPTYNEIYSNKKETKKSFKNTQSYQIIFHISEKRFNNLSHESIIKIAGRSAEFSAINQLLLSNKNAKPEDIKLTETTIVR
ncbi:hypothetical protein [Flavobacterium branchiicola]|uniref:Uncharacterized protein n=1 Tax=Flavobacterium branchiicola TaxID=1114875 RepID=A0ABV9PE42_9FLAO|nr:hypothetical protein [Flavobacterium branchiicola]MBS7254802.1 hypothetical protein [Flavobacterium branchiicola]